MRVIAGELGGRRLRAPRGDRTRPTSELVRGAIFSMLGDVSEAHVLDLFAGTGALGIEALSRGADRALFIERAAAAYAALQANLAALALGSDRAIARRATAEAALRTAQAGGESFGLVFIDPPYNQAAELAAVLDAALPGVLKATARVVVESDPRAPLRLTLPVQRERRHGHTLITIHSQP
jgi:16S rRNA (guanine(966)-N(2))-methyltransferase RsmD